MNLVECAVSTLIAALAVGAIWEGVLLLAGTFVGLLVWEAVVVAAVLVALVVVYAHLISTYALDEEGKARVEEALGAAFQGLVGGPVETMIRDCL